MCSLKILLRKKEDLIEKYARMLSITRLEICSQNKEILNHLYLNILHSNFNKASNIPIITIPDI